MMTEFNQINSITYQSEHFDIKYYNKLVDFIIRNEGMIYKILDDGQEDYHLGDEISYISKDYDKIIEYLKFYINSNSPGFPIITFSDDYNMVSINKNLL